MEISQSNYSFVLPADNTSRSRFRVSNQDELPSSAKDKPVRTQESRLSNQILEVAQPNSQLISRTNPTEREKGNAIFRLNEPALSSLSSEFSSSDSLSTNRRNGVSSGGAQYLDTANIEQRQAIEGLVGLDVFV